MIQVLVGFGFRFDFMQGFWIAFDGCMGGWRIAGGFAMLLVGGFVWSI